MPVSSLPRTVLLALAALPLAAAAAAAQETPAPPRSGPFLGLVVEAAGEVGGDDVATVFFEDGSTQSVASGQGVTIAVGGQVRPTYNSPLGLRGTVGLKYVTTKATNADITLTRVPLELVATYNLTPDVWIGGGAVRHAAVRFRSDGVGDNVDFDDANGATVELGWRWVALTYTAIRYRDTDGLEYDASSAGLSFVHTFGRR